MDTQHPNTDGNLGWLTSRLTPHFKTARRWFVSGGVSAKRPVNFQSRHPISVLTIGKMV